MTYTKMFYTRNEAAALLSLSVVTIDRLVKSGKLPCRKLGKKVLFTPVALEAFAATADTCR